MISLCIYNIIPGYKEKKPINWNIVGNFRENQEGKLELSLNLGKLCVVLREVLPLISESNDEAKQGELLKRNHEFEC